MPTNQRIRPYALLACQRATFHTGTSAVLTFVHERTDSDVDPARPWRNLSTEDHPLGAIKVTLDRHNYNSSMCPNNWFLSAELASIHTGAWTHELRNHKRALALLERHLWGHYSGQVIEERRNDTVYPAEPCGPVLVEKLLALGTRGFLVHSGSQDTGWHHTNDYLEIGADLFALCVHRWILDEILPHDTLTDMGFGGIMRKGA